MSNQYNNIPLELREGRRWVCFKLVQRGDKWTKVPFMPTGRAASTTDAATWSTFDEVCACDKYDGIGRVFVKADGYVGIDLDYRDNATIQAAHAKILAATGSYAETSPSGKGVHIIVKGNLPGGGRKRDEIGVEIYDDARFFTFTGNIIGARGVIELAQPFVNQLYQELGGSNGAQDSQPENREQTESDADICERIRRGANGAIFDQLFAGSWHEPRRIDGGQKYPSQSEADQAFCNIVWTVSGNIEQTTRIFHASGLGRRAKAHRTDYLRRLIGKASDRALAAAVRERLEASVATAIDRQGVKGSQPPLNGVQTHLAPPSDIVLSFAKFMEEYRPLDYVLEGIVARGNLYTLTSGTGAGKTTWLSAENVALASGDASQIGVGVKKGAVVYLTFENPDDFRMKLCAAAVANGKSASDLADLWVIRANVKPEVSRAALERMGVEFTQITVDTLQAAFDGTDFNNNKEMLEFIRRCRAFTELPGNPAVIVAAHPVKNAQADNLIPYGGGSVLNELDGNLTLSLVRETMITTLHWQGKFRGPEFTPISYHIRGTKCPQLLDVNGKELSPPTITPVSSDYVARKEDETEKKEMTLLQTLHNNPGMTLADLATNAGYSGASGAQKALDRMLDGKLVERIGKKYSVTNKGKKALEMFYGGSLAADVIYPGLP